LERVLIYRLGSLGDTVVALPCFHLIARTFASAERRLLTNLPVDSKAPSAASILGPSGLVNSYMSYPIGLRSPASLWRLAKAIKEWQPQLLVYLAEPRGIKATLRDAFFFRLSGVATIIGIPWRRSERFPQRLAEPGFYEREAARLARCIRALGDAAINDPESWNLRLTSAEKSRARELLSSWPGGKGFVACSLGTKAEVKDWGVGKWQQLLYLLTQRYRDLGLLLVGAREESAASVEAAERWQGPVLNLCGRTSPRETAALLNYAELYLGHDSGPMHLAAASGLRCVAVFSARSLPGVWFPAGHGHRVIYRDIRCAGCGLQRCIQHHKMCITSITVDDVYTKVSAALDESNWKAAGGLSCDQLASPGTR
jgi:ADP-heptose:LPS heptosyltransferase